MCFLLSLLSLACFYFLDLNEKRPAQENEYPCSNSLSSSRIFNDYIGDDESKCSVLFQ